MIKRVKQKLEKKYRYRIELHAHTNPVSGCSDVSPEELVEIYHKEKYDAVVITNHFFGYSAKNFSKENYLDFYLADYEKAKEYAKKYKLNVILAAEVRFDENDNDYLIFGVDRQILSMCYDYFSKGFKAFRNEVSLKKSVFVQAHPFRNGIEFVDSHLLDGYEIFNMHPNHNSRVALAVVAAKENGAKIVTVGSDFHHKNCNHEGISALRTAVLPKDSFELAKILKSNDFVFEIGKKAIVLP